MSASDALASENKRLAEALERERKAAQFERELSREKISHLEQTVTELTRQSTNDAFQAARKCAPGGPRRALRFLARPPPQLRARRALRRASARSSGAARLGMRSRGEVARGRGCWEKHCGALLAAAQAALHCARCLLRKRQLRCRSGAAWRCTPACAPPRVLPLHGRGAPAAVPPRPLLAPVGRPAAAARRSRAAARPRGVS